MNTLSSKSKLISRVLLSRPFSISSDSRVLCISFFSTSSHPNSPSNQQHFSASRRYEEESKNVRVSVWWDIENCAVPTGVNVYKISHFITSAVRANGIKGPVQVTAFGDVLCLSRANQEALSSTGVNLVHIPKGGKNSADRSLLVDLMYWVSQNPPPAHVFLISSDRDFAAIIHKLRMNNYNILLAAQEARSTPGVLCSAATIMWHWDELAKGENLSGRHFNQPPDGPFNSWYGHYRGPLEDPFDSSEQKSCLEADNISNSEQSSQPKRRPVPIPILRQIQRIVDEYPEGLSFNELRSAIAKYKVPIEKDIYSYKKFIRFLQSMPQIVRIETSPDGRMLLHPASRKSKKPVEENDTSGLITENKNQDVKVTKKETDQTQSITRMMDVEPASPVSPYVNRTEKTVEEKVKEEIPEKKDLSGPHIDTQVTSKKDLSGKDVFNEQAVKIPVPSMEEQSSENKISLFKRLWFGTVTNVKETSNNVSDKLDTSGGNPVMSTPKEEDTISSNQHGVQRSADASPINVLDENAKSDASDKCETSPGIFTRVLSWFKSWGNSSINATNEQTNLKQILIEGNSRNLDDNSHSTKLEPEMFSKDTFWNALQSFFKTRKGVDIVSSSTSREHFVERLQNEGPLVLQTLQESDLHYLVDLLISKRWIEEFPTKTPRFIITQPPADSSVEFQPQNVQSQSSKGLSSMFVGSSQENRHLTAASAVHKKPSEKSRSDVLADCQRLLDELLPRNPEGLNIGYFKRDFLDRYGYPLDHQKLGYPKLVSLLQIMPGVKLVGRYIIMDNVVYSPGIKSVGLSGKSSGSDSDLSDSQKNEGGESPWEELGPVTEQASDSIIGRVNGNYEPSLSDDDNEFSEPEENATSSTVNAEDRNRSKVNKDDSSLIQILESWYATNDSQDRDSHVDFLVDGANKNSKASKSLNASFKSESDSDACEWKKRPQKNYNFVANPIENETDDTIQGILGTLKKSGKSKEQE